ncbi:hypothetical protein OS493_008129 [Desmophyllum pertusum]|uniref:Uncharacterized protein n=1 Tax=Desmophyllum pertusum TaxID=174260 RepID=A0A9W9YF83_9CNID|nr:hypothetical protein OS493_008129 [Desmophyllum pertusum]
MPVSRSRPSRDPFEVELVKVPVAMTTSVPVPGPVTKTSIRGEQLWTIIVKQLEEEGQNIATSTDQKYAAKDTVKDYENRVDGKPITAEFDYKGTESFTIGDEKYHYRSKSGNTTTTSLFFITTSSSTQDNVTFFSIDCRKRCLLVGDAVA